jgi:hypothetical protein
MTWHRSFPQGLATVHAVELTMEPCNLGCLLTGDAVGDGDGGAAQDRAGSPFRIARQFLNIDIWIPNPGSEPRH